MARNVEVKARVDNLAGLRARVASRATAPPTVVRQTDTFFVVPSGRLKLRELDAGSGELIFYERADRAGPKESSYARVACAEPAALATVLGEALGVRGVVQKQREVFLLGRTRVHLDDVRHLGRFMEIEIVLEDDEPTAEGERVAQALLAELQIPLDALLAPAYIDLLEAV